MQPELSKRPLFQSSRGVRNSVKTGPAAIGIIRGSIILHAPSIAPERSALEKVVCGLLYLLGCYNVLSQGSAKLEFLAKLLMLGGDLLLRIRWDDLASARKLPAKETPPAAQFDLPGL